MKLFGKELFNFKGEPGIMYDFAQFGLLSGGGMAMQDLAVWDSMSKGQVGQTRRPSATRLSPKSLWKMEALNDHKFVIKTDPKYLVDQISQIEKKLDLMGKRKKIKHNLHEFDNMPRGLAMESGDVSFGRMELESILERLENRKKIAEFKDIVAKFPHTTSELIGKIINNNDHLRCAPIGGFVPDMPKEAVEAMKEYIKFCIDLCNKKPIFYIIAKHEDFQKKSMRRDPILLAQSPFGFFWQILGAWDEEMVYLGDL